MMAQVGVMAVPIGGRVQVIPDEVREMTDSQFSCSFCSGTAELADAQFIGLADTTDPGPFYARGCHQPFCSDGCAQGYYRQYYRSYVDLNATQQGIAEEHCPQAGDKETVLQVDDFRPFPNWD